jgi:hypothetical protein
MATLMVFAFMLSIRLIKPTSRNYFRAAGKCVLSRHDRAIDRQMRNSTEHVRSRKGSTLARRFVASDNAKLVFEG